MEAVKREKMSKSRGNVILVDEVTCGVCNIDPAYEFRDAQGQVIDWQVLHIWRNRGGDGMYYTGSRFGR